MSLGVGSPKVAKLAQRSTMVRLTSWSSSSASIFRGRLELCGREETSSSEILSSLLSPDAHVQPEQVEEIVAVRRAQPLGVVEAEELLGEGPGGRQGGVCEYVGQGEGADLVKAVQVDQGLRIASQYRPGRSRSSTWPEHHYYYRAVYLTASMQGYVNPDSVKKETKPFRSSGNFLWMLT